MIKIRKDSRTLLKKVFKKWSNSQSSWKTNILPGWPKNKVFIWSTKLKCWCTREEIQCLTAQRAWTIKTKRCFVTKTAATTNRIRNLKHLFKFPGRLHLWSNRQQRHRAVIILNKAGIWMFSSQKAGTGGSKADSWEVIWCCKDWRLKMRSESLNLTIID